MFKENTPVTVSTDVGGFFANPNEVQNLYEQAGFKCGLELVVMPLQYDRLKTLVRQQYADFNLDGVHGQLGADNPTEHNKGTKDYLLIKAADVLLPSVMGNEKIPYLPLGLNLDMAGLLVGKDLYLNVHNSVVSQNLENHLNYAKFANYSYLTIENGINKKDIQSTVGLIKRFKDEGVKKITGTFDVVHAVCELSGAEINFKSVTKHWNEVLKNITCEFRHLHLPIGVNNDSLPIMEMLGDKNMLSELNAVITESKIKVTFENQHSLLRGANKNKEVERLKKIREELIEIGYTI